MLLPDNHDPDSLVRELGVDGFVKCIDSSETLSDYFFKFLTKDLNLTEMEGRAQLVVKAKPYMEKLPEGVFKGMMVGRLKELSRVASLSTHDVSEAVAQTQLLGRKQVRGGGRLSTSRVALALLLQNPRLANVVEQKEIDWVGLDFPGIELFKSILQMIQDNKPANVAVLLELYRGAAEEKTIKALACLEQLFPDEGVDDEFCGALDRLLAQAKLATLNGLLVKEKNGGLDPQEKNMLRNMLANKSRSTK
jgi:DNA primase